MLIPPHYQLTPEISRLLQSIEASKEVIDATDISATVELNLRRTSTLKSALFSARIEGNDLSLSDISERSDSNRQKIEIVNILKALNIIRGRKNTTTLSLEDILQFHSIIVKGLHADGGKLRTDVSAIFNSAGIAVYMPPPPTQITSLLHELLTFIQRTNEQFCPIKACLAHYSFEKIHPFIDGNGRVGRLLLQAILHDGGYGMKGLLAIEEYLEANRSAYYRYLESPIQDVSEYLVFMLTALSETAETAKKSIMQKQDVFPEDALLPRRAEIYRILREHGMMNFDQIKRRFLKVQDRTLRYDLKKLKEGGFIIKRGMTKGVYYQPAHTRSQE